MLHDDYVDANEFCEHNNVEVTFIQALQEFGLIELTPIDRSLFIEVNKLQQLEKLARLHYELDINLEGLDVITYLLNRLEDMQQQVSELKNRLKIYES